MNQIKPFLFWIVIGVVLLAEILWWVLSIPDIDLVGNKAEAQKARATLDKEYTHLELLDKKAKKGSPEGVFDAENDADIRSLTENYLITPAWKDVLLPHVKRYDDQLAAIKDRLAARSAILGKPIAESTDKFGWYTAYQNATEEQLKRLHAGKALVTGNARPAAGLPLNGRPAGSPGMAAPVVPAAGDAATLDFAGDAALRGTAGFFTKGADLPEPSQHPLLTHQFRTMERIITVILRTTATDRANPLGVSDDAPAPRCAAIAGVSWDGRATTLGGDAAKIATGWQLTLTLQGPLSVLLSATAALDFPHEAETPIMVVTGAELTRKPAFTPGERKDVGSEDLTARLTIVMLDFTPGVVAAPADPAAAPTGLPPGMPPGMMPPGAPGNSAPPAAPPGRRAGAAAAAEGEAN